MLTRRNFAALAAMGALAAAQTAQAAPRLGADPQQLQNIQVPSRTENDKPLSPAVGGPVPQPQPLGGTSVSAALGSAGPAQEYPACPATANRPVAVGDGAVASTSGYTVTQSGSFYNGYRCTPQ